MNITEIYTNIFQKALYTKTETGRLLSKSESKIDQLVKSGELEAHNETPGLKGTTITTESIIKYIERHKVPNTFYKE